MVPNNPTPDNPEDFQRQLEQKSFEISYFRNQASELQTQIQLLQKVVEEIDAAKKSLDATDQLTQGTLVPLGAGMFAKAKTEKTGTVLINIGANVLAEKKPQDAAAILDARKATAVENLSKLTATFERLLERITQLTAEAEKMAQHAQTE